MARQTKFADAGEKIPLHLDKNVASSGLSYHIRALTPVFKGSAKPDGIDREYPFRAPSIRGQLRMWWRAVHPTTSVDDLRDQERQLFGGIGSDGGPPVASRVRVGLADMSSTPARKRDLRRLTGADLGYALWVDRSEDELYHVAAAAKLEVSVHRFDGDTVDTSRLAAATGAMLLFGGSGSRTRRGLGKLWPAEWPPVRDASDLAARVSQWCPPQGRRSWPSLAGVRLVWGTERHKTAAHAANAALDVFKDLRGMRPIGGGNFDGSHRLAQAQRDWERVRDARDLPDAFTAALGMPLLYRSGNGHLQGTTVVQPAGRLTGDRLPSPVHVCPVPTADGRFAATLMLLRPWFDGGIEASNRRSGARNRGGLASDAIDILAEGFRSRGWTVLHTGVSR